MGFQLNVADIFVHSNTEENRQKAIEWQSFLEEQQFDFTQLRSIDLTESVPVMQDLSGNKLKIDFAGDRQNYSKKKHSAKKELISRALGAGRYGWNVVDLSAGLGIDSVFLAQLGFHVTAVERNPLIYLALNSAQKQAQELNVGFVFGNSLDFLKSTDNDIPLIYFDPMFPEKTKSALPRQEMVFFRQMVGSDEDASEVLAFALQKQGVHRVVVKRPLKADWLGGRKPQSSIEGKMVRFDIYGGPA